MPHFTRRLPYLLRTSLLVLLALGLLTKPVLTAISGVHSVAHPEIAAVDGHGHSHDIQQDGEDPMEDHAQGSHGLMHQTGAGGAFDHGTARLDLPTAVQVASLLPPANQRPPSKARLTSPFRPPIA